MTLLWVSTRRSESANHTKTTIAIWLVIYCPPDESRHVLAAGEPLLTVHQDLLYDRMLTLILRPMSRIPIYSWEKHDPPLSPPTLTERLRAISTFYRSWHWYDVSNHGSEMLKCRRVFFYHFKHWLYENNQYLTAARLINHFSPQHLLDVSIPEVPLGPFMYCKVSYCGPKSSGYGTSELILKFGCRILAQRYQVR